MSYIVYDDNGREIIRIQGDDSITSEEIAREIANAITSSTVPQLPFPDKAPSLFQ